MATSTQGPAAYRHPRWLVLSVAIGFGFFYVCAIVAANVFPIREQEHGWPVIYMVRQDRVPGPLLNILYGPWPFDNPPIVQFWPAMLFLNMLVGSLFTAISAAVPVYWLRARHGPIHFSLRSLFVLTTFTACVLGAMKWRFPSANYEMLAAYSLVELRWLGPVCLALTAAHWLVVRSARSRRQWRWFGLHVLTWTWIAVLAVGIPCLHYFYIHKEWRLAMAILP
jgi:hypothetical protein